MLSGKKKAAFTLLEFLLCLSLILVLFLVAVPQFLDFRNETKSSTIRNNLRYIRSGIQMQRQNMILRCQAGNEDYPNLDNLFYNNITYNNNPCTDAQLPLIGERMIYDPKIKELSFFNFQWIDSVYAADESYGTLPRNVFNEARGVEERSGSAGCHNLSDDPEIGWNYNPQTGSFWANTLSSGIEECNF